MKQASKIWYNKIGFHNNPFSIKANKYDHQVLGSEEKIKEILAKIADGQIIYVNGEYGTGKTTLLKRIVNEFGGHRNIFYHSCNSGEKLNIPEMLQGKYRLFGRLFNLKATGMILLLDEVQYLIPEEELEILHYCSDRRIKSVVLVGKEEEIRFIKEIKYAIARNIYTFGKLTDQNAVNLIRRRIGNLPLLSDDVIKEINVVSKRNPRFLLENCEHICKRVIDQDIREVNIRDIDEFFY